MPTDIEEETLTLPSRTEWQQLQNTGDVTGPYIVIIYDDDWHTIDDVITQVRKATDCTFDKAYEVTMQVHEQGRAVAFGGTEEQCEKVARILREIRLQVETDRTS